MTRKQEQAMRAAAFVALVLGAGCGLVVDAQRDQCTTADDCATQLGGEAARYSCDLGLCRTAASSGCTADAVAATCGDSPTVQCVAGQCVDDVWGCWDQPDDRAAPSGNTATLNLSFLNVFTNKPPATLIAKACQGSTIDPGCVGQLPGAEPRYDAATGQLKILNVQVRPVYVAYRVKVEAEEATFKAAIDYYASRQPRDSDPDSQLTLIPADLAAKDGEDINLGNVIVRMQDCQGRGGAGVEVGIVDVPSVRTLYIDDNGTPVPSQTRTATLGVANIYNVPVGRPVTVFARVSPTRQVSYALTAFAKRYAYIDMFPRK